MWLNLECLSNESEVWCSRGILLMWGGGGGGWGGGVGGGHPLENKTKKKPYFLQSEAFCGVFIKKTL